MEKITVVNDEGKELTYEVLFTFDSDETKKSYIVCTNGTKDDLGNLEQYVFSYDTNKSEYELNPITDDNEWEMVKEVVNALLNK